MIENRGVKTVARERPDLLIEIMKDNFLPPPQMILALEALGKYLYNPEVHEFILELTTREDPWTPPIIQNKALDIIVGNDDNPDLIG